MIRYFPYWQWLAREWEGLLNHRQGVGFTLCRDFLRSLTRHSQGTPRESWEHIPAELMVEGSEAPRTHFRLFSKNGGFVCREKSHETVGWGVLGGNPTGWWRQKRKTQLEMGQVRGRLTMNPGWAGRRKWHGGQTSSKSALTLHRASLLKAAHRCAHAQQLKKKSFSLSCTTYPPHSKILWSMMDAKKNTQSEDT